MKVGLIGAGLQGKRRVRALEQFQGAELAMVADTNLDAAQSLARKMHCQATTKWEEVIARQDVEVLIICIPTYLHAPVSIAAAKRGMHILCEKPLARTIEEAEEMLSTCQSNKVTLKCGFNLRHHPGIQQAKEWLDEGRIGEPINLRLRYGIGGRPGYDREWRADPQMSGGGQLMDQGVHGLDLARYFLGDFAEVFGFLQTGFWDVAPLEDNAFALLRTNKRQLASLHVSWTQWKNLFSLEIFGHYGYILVEGLGGSYGVERIAFGRRDFSKPFGEEVIEYRGEDTSWYKEWEEFTDAIKVGREPLGNGYDGLQALKLAFAIYESARTRQVVNL
jgi:predicted dehydrogenase